MPMGNISTLLVAVDSKCRTSSWQRTDFLWNRRRVERVIVMAGQAGKHIDIGEA